MCISLSFVVTVVYDTTSSAIRSIRSSGTGMNSPLQYLIMVIVSCTVQYSLSAVIAQLEKKIRSVLVDTLLSFFVHYLDFGCRLGVLHASKIRKCEEKNVSFASPLLLLCFSFLSISNFDAG